MLKRVAAVVALSAVFAAPALAQGRTITVNMVTLSPTSFAYQPAQIQAHPGDTVKFVQMGAMPHNVQFLRMPTGAALGAAILGTFLTTAGQSYTLVMDARFIPGAYDFTCTPHQTMGMTGQLTVSPRGDAASR